jgi:hypothetical protein
MSFGGQGARREAGSEGYAEKYRAVAQAGCIPNLFPANLRLHHRVSPLECDDGCEHHVALVLGLTPRPFTAWLDRFALAPASPIPARFG